MVGFVIVVVCQ